MDTLGLRAAIRKRCQTTDGALNAPQQQTCLRLELLARIRHGTHDRGRREGEEQVGHQGRLDDLFGCTNHLVLFSADPFDEGVHVPVGGQVRWDQPQRRISRGVLGVEILRECQACRVNLGRGRDHRCPTTQKSGRDSPGNGGRGYAGDNCNLTRERKIRVRGRSLGRLSVVVGQFIASLVARLVGPPRGVLGHGFSGATEGDEGGTILRCSVPDASQVFASTSPTVVDEDGLCSAEPRLDHFNPARTQFGLNGAGGEGVCEALLVFTCKPCGEKADTF